MALDCQFLCSSAHSGQEYRGSVFCCRATQFSGDGDWVFKIKRRHEADTVLVPHRGTSGRVTGSIVSQLEHNLDGV